MNAIRRLFLGDLDTREVQESAELEAWKHRAPANAEVRGILFDMQLKTHSESLESYRIALRSFDGLMIFAGAMIAWLSKFISDLPDGSSVSRVLAGLAVGSAGLSLCVCFLGRRSISRPAPIGLPEAQKALAKLSKDRSQDWLSRTMHVNRRKFSAVLTYIATWLAAASWFLCLAVAFAVLAVCLQP